jgi:hypothetical protein
MFELVKKTSFLDAYHRGYLLRLLCTQFSMSFTIGQLVSSSRSLSHRRMTDDDITGNRTVTSVMIIGVRVCIGEFLRQQRSSGFSQTFMDAVMDDKKTCQ